MKTISNYRFHCIVYNEQSLERKVVNMYDFYGLSGKCPSGSISHTIRSGDTLYKLAQQYNTTVEAIIAINPGINPNNLQIGQIVCIPASAPPKPPCSGGFYYTIKAGDTLYNLANRYNVTVTDILRANPFIDPNNLQIGQVICIPGAVPPQPSCPGGTLHTIRSGDTFYKLSIQYGVSLESILKANPGVDPNNLQIGQVVCIPAHTPPQPSCPGGTLHTIRAGDTFYKLSIQYKVSLESILRANPGVDPNNLQIGQVVCIPAATPPQPLCPGGTLYTIRAGDTIYNLANRYNVSVDDILRANPGIDPNNLQIGQVICIPAPRCPGGTLYTIRAGDTIYNLANRYNVSVNDILKANPGIDPNNLQIGQVICIPAATPPQPSCPGGTLYTIRAGDTIYNLASRYNVSVNDILKANPGIDPNNLQIGQVICIPAATPPQPSCPGGMLYTIKAGDTIYNLANRYNVSVDDILKANPGIDPNNLQIGQVICIPCMPAPTPPQPSCPGGTLYTIMEGDNLGSILIKFNISVNDLISVNPNFDPHKIVAGQKLCIPPHKSGICPSGTNPYLITSHDAPQEKLVVAHLAMKFKISISDLMLANPNLAPSDFTVGMKICVPSK